MSKALITEEQALRHLRLEDSDPLIAGLIEAASEAVLDYLGAGAAAFTDTAGEVPQDSAGPLDIPAVIQHAALILLAELYDSRGGDGKNWRDGDLPLPVQRLLYRRRIMPLA